MNKITYTDKNVKEVIAFISPQPECSTCGGYGEYETEYGPRGCSLCCSRLIAIYERTITGKTIHVDWDDTIYLENGLFRVERSPQSIDQD